jgi:hypothetical protein
MFTKAALSRSRFALVLISALTAAAALGWQTPSAAAASPVTPTLFTTIHDEGHHAVTSVSAGTTVHDTGTVLDTLAGTPDGVVSFTWFTNANCEGAGTPAGSWGVNGSGFADGSTTEGPLAPGGYSFIAHFTSSNTVQWTDADSACEPLEVTPAPVLDLSGTTDAASSYGRTITWGITKSADPAKQIVAAGDPATFDYTVVVTHDEGTDSDWQVSGQIDVHNGNNAPVDGVTVTNVIDDPSATCAVTDGSPTVPAGGNVSFDYTCTYTSAPVDPSQTSAATISWPTQALANFSTLPAGSTTASTACSTRSSTPARPRGRSSIRSRSTPTRPASAPSTTTRPRS